AVRVQEDDLELAAVAGIDQAGRVHDRDPVAVREPGPRLDKACVPFGDGHGEARADDRALAGRELDPLTRSKVEAGVSFGGAGGNDRVRAEPLDRQPDQATR